MTEVYRELQRGNLRHCIEAQKMQRLAAKERGERRAPRDGEWQMQVHPAYYHYWGQRLGYECWEDAGFVREFLRDNPECRVKNLRSPRVPGWRAAAQYARQTGQDVPLAGAGAVGTARRYRKVYS